MTLKSSLLAAAALTFCTGSAIAATAHNADLSAGAMLTIYDHPRKGGMIDDEFQWVINNPGHLNNLSIDMKASIPNFGTSSASTETRASATWNNANSGHVRFDSTGISSVDIYTQDAGNFVAYNANGVYVPTAWDYSFTTEGYGTFDLESAFHRDMGPQFPALGKWYASISELVDGEFTNYKRIEINSAFGSATDATSASQFALDAGKTYKVEIYDNSAEIRSADPTYHDLDYTTWSDFNWSITDDGVDGGGGTGGGGETGAVPEPASWALMLGGFGAIGGAMRMSRRKARIAFN